MAAVAVESRHPIGLDLSRSLLVPPPIRVWSRFVPGGGDLGGQVDSDELNLGDWTGLTGFKENIYSDLSILMH